MAELPGTSGTIAAGLLGCALLAWLRADPPGPRGTLVEVRGAVERPGYHLAAAATVDGALVVAGVAPSGDRRALLAGDRVEIGPQGVVILPPTDPVLVGRTVDANLADEAALAAVPGLGERTAAAIVADRAERGPFRSVAALGRVRGVGQRAIEAAAVHLSVEEVPPLDLNRATAPQLETLDGIGPALAARIVEDRERRGPFPDVAALARVKGIGPALVEGLSGAVVAVPP